MSEVQHGAYKKLPISKLKSLLSARGITMPHVKDQPKEVSLTIRNHPPPLTSLLVN